MDDWWYEGDAIWMGVEAGDPDGDELTFTAQGLPPGIQIDPHRGTLYGPFERITSVGRHEITITVSDGRLSASETVTWEIREKNRAPWLPRPKDQKNYEHDTVFFQLAGADPDWDPITFTATGLPAGSDDRQRRHGSRSPAARIGRHVCGHREDLGWPQERVDDVQVDGERAEVARETQPAIRRQGRAGGLGLPARSPPASRGLRVDRDPPQPSRRVVLGSRPWSSEPPSPRHSSTARE